MIDKLLNEFRHLITHGQIEFMTIGEFEDGLRSLTAIKFCKWHVATKENPAGTDCSAHMHDGRVFKCQFKTPKDRMNSKYPCSDYEESTP